MATSSRLSQAHAITQTLVPETMPLHYFDGTNWLTIQPRIIEVTPEVSSPINKTVLLDWEKKRKTEITIGENTTKKITTKHTTQPTTTLKSTKRTTQKTTQTIKQLEYVTQRTIRTGPRCIYNLCNEIFESTTKKTKKLYEVWKEITRKPTFDPKYITNPTVSFIPRWIIREVTTKEAERFPKRMTAKNPLRKKRESIQTTKSAIQFSTLPKNWLELMNDFVRALKPVGSTSMCGSLCLKDTTTAPFKLPLSEKRREKTNVEDLINILTDGVEIDDGLVDDMIEENYPLDNYKDIEYPVRDDKVEDLVLKHTVDSTKINNYQHSNENLFLQRLSGHLDEDRPTNEKKDDVISQDGEIAAYIDVFINRYLKPNSTSQSQQYNDSEVIHGKINKEVLPDNDRYQRSVALEALVKKMEPKSYVPKKFSMSNLNAERARLLKEHRKHWKERDIRQYLNKVKENYAVKEKVKEEDTRNISVTLNKSATFASLKKTKPKNNVHSDKVTELLLNKDVQSLFNTFVLFLMNNISVNAQEATKLVKEINETPKLNNTALEKMLKLNKINPLFTKFRSKSIEINSQPLPRSVAKDMLPIQYFFDHEDENISYGKEDNYYEEDDTEELEMDLTGGTFEKPVNSYEDFSEFSESYT
ncbi:hypothetical protein HF086_012470 [Spodoptera exigua]|uniref:Uncharacterized protein n=1 Tax=Spodoptera exigua TaxID=7107 RepID=A0A922M5N3_SPOEX|nr:hypothetical protein HF086_012470 [Spodoptera exigua]